MPRFFFHVRNGSDLIRDDEGLELSSLDDVRREAWEGARGTAIFDLNGSCNQQFEITDEAGIIVLVYPFKNAFK